MKRKSPGLLSAIIAPVFLMGALTGLRLPRFKPYCIMLALGLTSENFLGVIQRRSDRYRNVAGEAELVDLRRSR